MVDPQEVILLGDILDLKQASRGTRINARAQKHLISIVRLLLAREPLWIVGNHDRGLLLLNRFAKLFHTRGQIYIPGLGVVALIHGDRVERSLRRCNVELVYWFAAKLYRGCLHIERLLRATGLHPTPGQSLVARAKTSSIGMQRRSDRIARSALELARSAGAFGVFMGHIHQPCIRAFDDTLYVNCGDWIENCTAVVQCLSGDILLLRYVGVNRGHKSQPTLRVEARFHPKWDVGPPYEV